MAEKKKSTVNKAGNYTKTNGVKEASKVPKEVD